VVKSLRPGAWAWGCARDKCWNKLTIPEGGREMNRRLVVAVVILVVVLFFFVPLVPSTITTNVPLPCALRGGPCPLLNPPSLELVTFHFYASLGYASLHVGIVYSPELNGRVRFIG
jgi:hypothetical protein